MNGEPRIPVVVIGSGFGGTLTALTLAREFQKRNRGEKVVILERGTWRTTPVGTVQDREVETYDFLRNKGQPVQFWASAENFRGFNTPEAAANGDPQKFHTIEDQGIPRALASLIGHGVPLLRSLSKGRRRRLFIAYAVGRYALSRLPAYVRAFVRNRETRQEQFVSEDEWTMDMMCAVAMGRDKAVGRFRLGSGWRDTALRLERTDTVEFINDPIYTEIEATLARFAKELSDDPEARFENPFLGPGAELAGGRSVTLTHPLGGCVMADTGEGGVVDALGHVFDTTSGGVRTDLYIADGSAIPTALGVNPSLTISAVALRIADHIVGEIRAADRVHAPAEATTSSGKRASHGPA